MAEAVRLVIWDLDETFWGGTLSEGGVDYKQSHHDIVIELARRGIVSSICSKNNFDEVEKVLVEKGIWEYFVFPSIDWNPKGPRIKTMVEDIQLRPETILLIDDNPLNLGEAQHFVPGIQTSGVDIIPAILRSPLFKGKNDENLTRLNQYRLLETRKADEAIAEDNREFLRSCNIKVEIEHDVEANIDRAIELINRTNQLNFTKRRLPEDGELARAELRNALSRFYVQAGLVRVSDRYGDYGYCGFYLKTVRARRTRLQHFCFSCRILNMGVERWLYERLGRPGIDVQEEVLADLSDKTPVDWITAEGAGGTRDIKKQAAFPGIFARGACQVIPLTHYFKTEVEEVVGEFNTVREGIAVRTDHSLMLRYALEGLSSEQMAVLNRIGYAESDFRTQFTHFDGSWLRILAFWTDAMKIIYRHRETGMLIPFDMKGFEIRRSKRDKIDLDGEEASSLTPRAKKAMSFLREEFDRVGLIPEEEHNRSLDVIFDALPKGDKTFVLKGSELANGRQALAMLALNKRTQSAIERHPGKVTEIAIPSLDDVQDTTRRVHFHRKVYYEIYRAISAKLAGSGDGEANFRRQDDETLVAQ
jgi:FkbH-like protein